MHTLFHAEHNRLVAYIDKLIHTPGVLTPDEITAWESQPNGAGWTYGERLFQAGRFVTEMEYQHLVFEEFARKVQPLINPFLGGITNINGAISAEFAHTVYRLGHSMLPEVISRINADGSTNDKRLFDAFLNPAAFNDGGPAGTLPAAKAAGSIFRGLSRQVGNELDEFVTASVRNTLVGLPLDLPAINIARGRSEGMPSLNSARRQFFTATRNSAVVPYANWFEFGLNLKHRESLENFIAAYGKGSNAMALSAETTLAGKRAAAHTLLSNNLFMFEPAATSGLDDVDFWPGGMAERQAAFGGLLGSTFNFVFEQQLENLQNGDRFYYLQRTDGLNLRFQLESNSLAELAMRNTDVSGLMQNSFDTADFNFDMSTLTGTAPVELGFGMQVLTTADGTKLFFDPLHTGKNVVFNGTEVNDRIGADIGDDSLYGNGGNDRIEGNDGNDTIVGGDGDDILFGGNGDDVLKGGPGDDALSSGPGFGGDILLGGDGNDFLLGGDDGVEHFGGTGDDVMLDGAERAEGMFGGDGDDWIEAGDGHDGGIFGDGGNVFDLNAGLSAVGGNDVLEGGPGQDNHFGEGGDDIMLMSEGSNKFFGDYGFDWITLRGWPVQENIQLFLLALPNAPVNFNDLRNKYRFVDGASGWDLNDHIQGAKTVLCVPPAEVAECYVPGMELTVGNAPQPVPAKGVPNRNNLRGGSGALNITGLTQLMTQFNKSLTDPAIPGIKNVGFMGGDILLGGRGNDILEGNGGDDLIDGDLWLNVQLRAVLNDGTIKLVNSGRDLIDDVFADDPAFNTTARPFGGQRLNPGNISIVRTIVTPGSANDPNPAPAPPPDCNAAVPLNCDTAVFSGNLADYDITTMPNGTTIVHDNARPVGAPTSDGTDSLRNIERLQFADVTIPTPGVDPRVVVPNVVGLTEADATAAIVAARLTLGDVGAVFSNTIPIDSVVSQNPAAGIREAVGSRVGIDIALGVGVPDLTGLTQAQATAAILAANVVVGTITLAPSTTAAIGTVIGQSPGFLERGVVIGSAVALTISTGTVVPNVVTPQISQAAATALINAAGLAVGTVTTATSGTVLSGNVISQSVAAGTSVNPGTSISLVVSTGPELAAPLIGVTVRTVGAAQTNVINSPQTGALAANTLVVVFVSANNANQDVPNTIVNSVAALTGPATLPFTLVQRANAQLGTAEIWSAFTTATHATTQVRAVLNHSEYASITVVTFTGAASSVGAAHVATSARTGQPISGLATTRSNSWVYAVGTDWDSPRTLTAGPGQTIVNQSNVTPPGDTYWVQRTTNPVVTPGFVPVSVTYPAPMGDRWNMALIEIRHP